MRFVRPQVKHMSSKGKIALVHSNEYTNYGFPPPHPLQSVRFLLPYELLSSYSVLRKPTIKEYKPSIASENLINLAHGKDYVNVVKACKDDYRYGFGMRDNPVFKGMYEAAASHVGGTVLCCDLVAKDEVLHAFTLGGGFHHALPNKASGFCIFNDLVICIKYLKKYRRAKKIMYVDIDAHHADGVQRFFYNDCSVLTVSLHESGRYLFPGTGFVSEIGVGNAVGFTVNVPLPLYTFDEAYLHAFRELVPTLSAAFKPDFLITQLGMDTHYLDPLTHLTLTTKSYQEIAKTLREVAHENAKGRWIATGGGGYSVDVLSRGYAIMANEMLGIKIPDEIPEAWRSLYKNLTRESPAQRLLDRVDLKIHGKKKIFEKVKKVVEDVKRKVFPYHGIE